MIGENPGYACPRCRTLLEPDGAWCTRCGYQARETCWECGRPLAPGSEVCAGCGLPGSQPSTFNCGGCGHSAGRLETYCTVCGEQVQPACAECDTRMRSSWSHCPQCGGERADPETEPEIALDLSHIAPKDSPPPEGEAPGAAENAEGVNAYAAERFEEARRAFQAAVDLDPSNPEYLISLAVTSGELGDREAEEANLRRALKCDPQHPQALLYLGNLHLEREEQSLARDCWEQVIAVAPSSEEAAEARENLAHLDSI